MEARLDGRPDGQEGHGRRNADEEHVEDQALGELVSGQDRDGENGYDGYEIALRGEVGRYRGRLVHGYTDERGDRASVGKRYY